MKRLGLDLDVIILRERGGLFFSGKLLSETEGTVTVRRLVTLRGYTGDTVTFDKSGVEFFTGVL